MTMMMVNKSKYRINVQLQSIRTEFMMPYNMRMVEIH